MEASFPLLDQIANMEHIKECLGCQVRVARIRHQLEGIDRCIRDEIGKARK